MTNKQTSKEDDKCKRFPRKPLLGQEAINGGYNKAQGCSHIMHDWIMLVVSKFYVINV